MMEITQTSTMQDSTTGFYKSLWVTSAEADVDYPKLSEHLDTSVVVIGAGFTGLSTALHLSERNIDVTVLDAHEIGFGASGRNGGQVNPGWKILPDDIIHLYGKIRGHKLLQMLGDSCDLVFKLIEKYQIECSLRQAPYLRAAYKKRGLVEVENWVRQWAALDKPVELLDKVQTAELMGSDFFDGSFVDAQAGSLQPLSYVRGLARAAKKEGARLFVQSAAETIERNGKDWIVKTKNGQVSAQFLVIATNGYTSNLWPGLDKQVVPVASLVTASKPLPETILKTILPKGHHVSDTRRNMIYCKIDENGRFVIGGRGQPFAPDKQFDGSVYLQQEAKRIYPQLANVEWEYNWGGLVAMTQTHTPHLIELDANAYAGLGYNGRGVAMGTMMGKLLAQTIVGEECAMQPEKLTPIRFHQFRNLGVFWYMLTAKWLDRLDTR